MIFYAEAAVFNYIAENFDSMKIDTKPLKGLPGLTLVTVKKTGESMRVFYDYLNNKVMVD